MKHMVLMVAGLLISASAFAKDPCPLNKDMNATKRQARVASVLSTGSTPPATVKPSSSRGTLQ